jgi:Helix-turn-helix domain
MTQPRLPDQAGSAWANEANTSRSRFINPHRLFHGVWLPQWLEERPEVSEKAKKLYAYLTYFAGGKGCAWPSLKILADKLHCSRRHVVRLVQELSAHRLVTVTNIRNPRRGHCAKLLPFSLASLDAYRGRRQFRSGTSESAPLDVPEESAPDNCQTALNPGDVNVTQREQ